MKMGSQGYSTNKNLFWTVFGFIVLGLILLMVTGTLQYRPQPLAFSYYCYPPTVWNSDTQKCELPACSSHDSEMTADDKGNYSSEDFDEKVTACGNAGGCTSRVSETHECSGIRKYNIDINGNYSEEDIKNLREYCQGMETKHFCTYWRVCTWKSVDAETGTCSYEPGEKGSIKEVSCDGLNKSQCNHYIGNGRGCELKSTKELTCSDKKCSSCGEGTVCKRGKCEFDTCNGEGEVTCESTCEGEFVCKKCSNYFGEEVGMCLGPDANCPFS
jgi:hypothetical protein